MPSDFSSHVEKIVEISPHIWLAPTSQRAMAQITTKSKAFKSNCESKFNINKLLQQEGNQAEADNGGVSAGRRVDISEGVVGALKSQAHGGFGTANRISVHFAHWVLLLWTALGVALGHQVDNGADKEAYHDDHNLLKEPWAAVLLLPGSREKGVAWSVTRGAPFTPLLLML